MTLEIWTKLYTPYLEKPISFSRQEAKKVLIEKNKNTGKKLICVDWTNFSDNVKIIEDKFIKNINSALLLPAWIDWVVALTKEKIELALPVWDCWLLVANHKDLKNETKILWNSHLWYKWVISSWDLEKNWIIENFLKKLKEVSNCKDFNEFDFYLAPMAWANFELPKKYFDDFIKPFIEKQNKDINSLYSLDPEDFITDSKNFDSEEKVYFNLKALIFYILQYKYNIFIKEKNILKGETTDPKNNLSSFRSHTLAKNIPEKVLKDLKNPSSAIISFIYKEKHSLENIEKILKKYSINMEQLFLILNWKVDFYKNTNSRLSLNIFTKEKNEEN